MQPNLSLEKVDRFVCPKDFPLLGTVPSGKIHHQHQAGTLQLTQLDTEFLERPQLVLEELSTKSCLITEHRI